MPHILFKQNDQYNIAILIKDTSFAGKKLKQFYYDPLVEKGVPDDSIIAFNLDSQLKTAKPQKAFLANLLPGIDHLGVKYLFVNDVPYFKALTGVKDASCTYGSIYPCTIAGFEHLKVISGVNYQSFMYDPKQKDKLDLSIVALAEAVTGLHLRKTIHFNERKFFTRKSNMDDIKDALAVLLEKDELAIDVEDKSLNVMETVVGTISFSWGTDNAYVFAVASDYANEGSAIVTDDIYYQKLIKMLKTFFSHYTGNKVYHRANYDTKVLIFNLFMGRDPFNHSGLLEGIDKLVENFDDTKLIAYLATNSTARNELGLKILALPFAGDYGRDDIKDITKIPLDELMDYNSIDTISTFWVKQKYMPIVIQDNQLNIYENLFKPSMKDIVHMELVGVPLDMPRVAEVAKILEHDLTNAGAKLADNKYVAQLITSLRLQAFNDAHAKWKNKTAPLSAFDYITYNPQSNQQNQELLYDIIGLPELDFTAKGNVSTGGDTLKKLRNHTTDPDALEILDELLNIAEAAIIYNNFIQKFLHNSIQKSDGRWYLHGNFNIGGTVSGRLSSSDPNLQNLPSTGNKYAKLVKSCVVPPEGYLLVGADFSSLEDRISALITKDPNKIKIYTDGYCGHCLRAYAYFNDKMPDIDPDSVDSINSIAKKYPDIRQLSKAPTFLLTYHGTHFGLTQNCGFPTDVAKKIEHRFHELYAVSDQWVDAKIAQAAKQGYVEVAFDLRVRTPLLAKTTLNTKVTPYEAQAESRTVGNALGQSYGLLNNRAAVEFRQRFMASKWVLDILPIMQIHDAQYLLIRENLDLLMWVNKNLIECMQWQDLPDIRHDQVKLGGELSVFHPAWDVEIKLKNNATKQEIINLFKEE